MRGRHSGVGVTAGLLLATLLAGCGGQGAAPQDGGTTAASATPVASPEASDGPVTLDVPTEVDALCSAFEAAGLRDLLQEDTSSTALEGYLAPYTNVGEHPQCGFELGERGSFVELRVGLRSTFDDDLSRESSQLRGLEPTEVDLAGHPARGVATEVDGHWLISVDVPLTDDLSLALSIGQLDATAPPDLDAAFTATERVLRHLAGQAGEPAPEAAPDGEPDGADADLGPARLETCEGITAASPTLREVVRREGASASVAEVQPDTAEAQDATGSLYWLVGPGPLCRWDSGSLDALTVRVLRSDRGVYDGYLTDVDSSWADQPGIGDRAAMAHLEPGSIRMLLVDRGERTITVRGSLGVSDDEMLAIGAELAALP